ncbi:DUF3304 domain-containing protein [Duganella aceris]|uniref:DUF3304 domain-containing protein n=1 Tax=Duganella aceris TaxID=2703883 RepID=A0ABX0FL62_9BURK|nr:DUF3304 domain-containing protein [Duganella aceris]NGZ85332.1 DUF3304 domain-containing protein [Duganella aceris]
MNLKNTLRFVFLCTGLTSLLASCAPVGVGKPKELSAAVRSINYSGKEVVLMVVDPTNKDNGGGGDVLNPYSSGGTICCFGIPAEWRPGLQVIVKYTVYPDTIWHEQLVDVPPYAQGIAGDLWLAMHEDGRAEAVVSNFGPTRPEWPGRVKGRPVQSEGYAAKLKSDRLHTQKAILEKMEKGLAADTGSRTKEELDRLKSAIENTKQKIRLLEEQQP